MGTIITLIRISWQPEMKIICSIGEMNKEKAIDEYRQAPRCYGKTSNTIINYEKPIEIIIRNVGKISAQEVNVDIKIDKPFMISFFKLYKNNDKYNSYKKECNNRDRGLVLRLSDLKEENKDHVKILLWYCYNKKKRGRKTKGTLTAEVNCPKQKRHKSEGTKCAIPLTY